MPGKKRTKSKPPVRRSERKKKRTPKGKYYHENFEECISGDIPTGSDETDQPAEVSEKSDTQAEATAAGLDVPENPHITEKVDTISPSTSIQVVEVDTPITVNTTGGALDIDKRDSSTIENHVSSTEVEVLTPSAITVLTQDIATCSQKVGVSEESYLVTQRGKSTSSTSTPSSMFKGNLTCPTIVHSGTDQFTPVRRTRRTQSLSLKHELELATSFSSLENQPRSNLVGNMFPTSVADIDPGVVKEIHFELEKTSPENIDDNDEPFLSFRNIQDLYEISDHCRKNNVVRELQELIEIREELVESIAEHGIIIVDGHWKRGIDQNEAYLELLEAVQLEKRKREEISIALENEIQEREKLGQLFHNEKLKNEKLSDQLLERFQLQKKAEMEIEQLRDDSSYRREVVRMEKVIEGLEAEKVDMIELLEKQNEEIEVVRNSLSHFMTENTVLKNRAKQQKTESKQDTNNPKLLCSDCGIRTDKDGFDAQAGHKKYGEDAGIGVSFGVDFGVDVSVQTDAETSCEGCENHMHTINELTTWLKVIEELVTLTEAENKATTIQNQQQPGSSGNYYWAGDTKILPDYSHELKNVVPGTKLYSKSHLWTTMVISDSMPTKMNYKMIRPNIDTNVEAAIFKKFPGHTADEIAYYAAKPLYDNKPNQVIVIAGTNDLTRELYRGNTVNEYEVVENLMKIGRTARDAGAHKVHISAIMARHGYQYKNPIIRINNLLQYRCSLEGFHYMDQSEISSDHVSSDGVHLNFFGLTVLKMNILSCFHTFNPYLSDFLQDYEHAKL